MSRAGASRGLALLAVALACNPVQPPPGTGAPVNLCPSHPCTSYVQVGVPPTCNGDACVVIAPTASSLLVTISLAGDAHYAPGATYALPLSTLVSQLPSSSTPADCQSGTCGQLPGLVPVAGNVVCQPSTAQSAGWYLGPGAVALPVQATFRPVWLGSAPVDATALGLPLLPVVAATVPNPGLGNEVPPGPQGGPSLVFSVPGGLPPLAPPLVYERTLQPMAPLDQAYPPDILDMDLSKVPAPDQSVNLNGFDHTNVGGGPGYPTFTVSRADGQALDGWSAYLRDQATGRRVSNLSPLHGATEVVQLATHWYQADALTGAELVMTPPTTASLPTWSFTPVGVAQYPRLPPTLAQGSITSRGAPLAADLVFDAVDLCRYAANGTTPKHDSSRDFSFSQRVAAPGGSYAVALPLGIYRLTVIPRVAGAAITVDKQFVLADSACNPAAATPVSVEAPPAVRGTATVADGRPLADATVDAVPALCADGTADATCMPRFATTRSDSAGAYSLLLDPGTYALRVRPAEGSRLPWVVQTIVVPTPPTTSLVTQVPAPVYAGLRLFDPLGDPIFRGLVRMFQTSSSGPPVQVGEALTDATGHYDMYLVPATQ